MGRGNTLPPIVPASGRQDASGRRSRAGLQMGKVVAILEEHGLDPTAEIARVLTTTVPVTDRNGNPVLDPETGQQLMRPLLDAETHARFCLELMRFVHPTLKAVDVKAEHSGTVTALSPEQAKAIAAEYLKATEGDGT